MRFNIHRLEFALVVLATLILFPCGSIANDRAQFQRLQAEVDEAELAMHIASENYASEKSTRTKDELRRAENRVAETREKLESARIETLVEFSGRPAAEIRDQRARGENWTVVADDLGVHPSIIGIELIDDAPPPFATPGG